MVTSKRRFFEWANAATVQNLTQRAVLKAVVEFCDENGETFRGQQSIAERVSCSEITVRRHLAQLEILGLIERRHRYDGRGKRKSDLIRILPFKMIGGGETTGQSEEDYRSDSDPLPVKLTAESTDESTDESFPLAPQGVEVEGFRIGIGSPSWPAWVERIQRDHGGKEARRLIRQTWMIVASEFPPDDGDDEMRATG
ncbi:helix-turn-helix domain-containing protein [Mesorhizobium sp. USDA 4775]